MPARIADGVPSVSQTVTSPAASAARAGAHTVRIDLILGWRTGMGRWVARALAAVVGCLAAAVAFVGVAYAHVEVSADPPVEGATNAVVTFTAEAESPTSGVASVRIV